MNGDGGDGDDDDHHHLLAQCSFLCNWHIHVSNMGHLCQHSAILHNCLKKHGACIIKGVREYISIDI